MAELVDIGQLAASEHPFGTVTRTCFVLLLASDTALLACPPFFDPETHVGKLKRVCLSYLKATVSQCLEECLWYRFVCVFL